MPPHDDTTIKLAQVEAKLEAMFSMVERIEGTIARFVSLDRTIAELSIQHNHTQEKISDLRNSVTMCNQSHRASSEAMTLKVNATHDKVNELESKSSGALKIVSWFCGVATAGLIASGAWVFQTASESSKVNAVQQERIERMERDLNRRPAV